MASYVVRRVAQALVVLLGVSVVVFALVHLVPGDPIRVSMGTRFNPDAYEALRARAGFDLPLPVQYGRYLANAAAGDLGVSFRSGDPVTTTLLGRLPATLSLAGSALLVALLIAVPLGIFSAIRSGSKLDYVATVFSQAGISLPDFWMAILLILLFSGVLGWLPPSGYVSPLADPIGWLSHLVLPAITVGVVSGSILTRFVRSSVLESLGEDYTRTARSKGLHERTVVTRHVLRNALVPIITVTGLQLAYLLGGVIIVEVIFAWPGLGQLALLAVQSRDYPVLQGTVLLVAVVFLLINLIVDLLYAAADPRIRYK
ncbi:MAG: ABC transporter permease subunit [Nitriliruptorales bacterium]|nr:ABC transporter permease subunit [Nitriliruptorales bacterium]